MYCTNSTGDENFKLKLCMCAQSLALGTRTNFQIEILTINVISGVVYFRENILGSLRNVSETAPWPFKIDPIERHTPPYGNWWECPPGSKTYPWLRSISWSRAHFYKILDNFSPNIPPFFKRNFPKVDANLARKCQCPKMPILGGFHKKYTLG